MGKIHVFLELVGDGFAVAATAFYAVTFYHLGSGDAVNWIEPNLEVARTEFFLSLLVVAVCALNFIHHARKST